jgi:AsmA-like protein
VVMVNSKNITADLSLNVKEPDFKHLISLIPAVYSEDFKKVKTTGSLALDGYVKGKYNGISYPAFGVSLKIDKGSFQYPQLPAAVTGINIDVKAKNPGGSLDNTVIDVDKFNMSLAGDPFNMTLHVTSPVLDPEIDAALNGKVDLGGVKNYYPLKGDELSGNVGMNVKAKGKLSAIEKQQYQNFDADGTIEMSDVKYVSKDLPKALQINKLKLTFKPELVNLDAFSAQIGKSDFTATGELDNLLNYMFSKATLKGRLKLQANVLDLNEFLAEDSGKKPALAPEKKSTPAPKPATAAKPAPKASSTSAQVPANIDFTIDAYAAKVYYTNIVIDSLAGEVVIRNETITLNGLQGKVFDGNIVMNGDYTTLRTETPRVDMKMNLSMISVEKAVVGFEKLLSSIPIVKSATGVLSTVLTVKTDLDKEMSPKLKTMVAEGRIDIHHMEFKPNKTTNSLAERTKMNELRLIKAKDFFTNIKVANGNLFVEPFNIPMGKINITIYGSHDMTDSSSANYNMVMDAPAGSDSTAKGKRTKFKVGMHGKAGEPSVHQASDDNDTAIQNATAEQQSLKEQAGQAKASAETKFQQEQDKRKQAAAEKAQKKAERLKQHADQKAKDQAGTPE